MPVLRGERSACLGHERAGRGQRPGRPQHASGARRRPLRDQRPEGVDLRRQLRRLLLPLLPHRPRRARSTRASASSWWRWTRPGITVRPLPEIVDPEDRPDLNEVFLADVIVPAENLVGDDEQRVGHGQRLARPRARHGVARRRAEPRGGHARGLVEEAPAALARLAADGAGGGHRPAGDAPTSTPSAGRCLGYRGFAKLVRGGSAPEQALMKASAARPSQRLDCSTSPRSSATAAIDLALRRSAPRSRQQSWIERVLPHLRRHDLGRLVGDPAQHHRREGARPSSGLTRPICPTTASERRRGGLRQPEAGA